MDLPTSSQTSSLQAALQFLIPGFNPTEHTSFPSSSTSSSSMLAATTEALVAASMPRLYPHSASTSTPFFYPPPSTASASSVSAVSATANIMTLPSSDLLNLVGQVSMPPTLAIPSISPSMMAISATTTPQPTSAIGGGPSTPRTESPAAIAGPSGCGSNQSLASPGSDTDYMQGDPFEGGVLPDSDIPQIIRQAKVLYAKRPELHALEPRFVQNKKKLPKELLDVMNLPPEDRNRLSEFRRFSAIYGRYDAKRKPDRPLSYHELLVNEAAAQLCLLQPVLLTRRDELFPLARATVRESNFPAFRTLSRGERKRPFDSKSERSTSPHSVTSNR